VNRIPDRRRPLVALATAAGVLVLVVVGVLVVARLASPETATPSLTGTPSQPATTTSPPSADPSTPEGAVHAFFAALKEARRTDDPALLRPHVTSDQSSAYLSVEGFLLGQKAVNKASVLTVQVVEDISVDTTDDTATVRLVYTEGGYDISLETGEALESPSVLAPRNVTMELRRISGRWLVDSYEATTE
jgi:hypothetical protein